MREDSMLEFKTPITLSSKDLTAIHGADGMSDMSRMSKPTNQVNSIQDMDSTVTKTSTLSPREMASTCHQWADK